MTHPHISQDERGGAGLSWKVHTPNLLREIFSNKGTEALRLPLNIFGRRLAEVAERAAEINDPALNILMLDLTLYELGDPEQHSTAEIAAAYKSQLDAIAKAESAS